jgi:hypothetical protein
MERNIIFNRTKKVSNAIDVNKKHVPSMEYISPLNKKINKKLIIMIRGHIRDSFKDKRLAELLESLSQKYNTTIYLHTWNILQSDKSWRQMERNDTEVTETMILDYFSVPIKEIIIEDESNIELIGNTDGNISISLCPTICWKNMWYGMNKIMNIIEGSPDTSSETTILNIRFDIFTNRNRLFTIPSIKKLIHENFNKYLRNNIFITKEPVVGIDNLILGSVYSMKQLINHFYKDLDKILEKYPEEIHQEFIVYKENPLLK